jgi:hypothetical protein
MDQSELDAQDRFDRREKREKQEERHRQLVNTILRRARVMRDVTHAVVREEPDANDAWIELDNAIKSLDDFAAITAEKPR